MKKKKINYNLLLKNFEADTGWPLGFGTSYKMAHFKQGKFKDLGFRVKLAINKHKSNVSYTQQAIDNYKEPKDSDYYKTSMYDLEQDLAQEKSKLRETKQLYKLLPNVKRKVSYIFRKKVQHKELAWVHHDKYGVGMVRGYRLDFNKSDLLYYRVAFKRGRKPYYRFVRPTEIVASEAGDLLFGKLFTD